MKVCVFIIVYCVYLLYIYIYTHKENHFTPVPLCMDGQLCIFTNRFLIKLNGLDLPVIMRHAMC